MLCRPPLARGLSQGFAIARPNTCSFACVAQGYTSAPVIRATWTLQRVYSSMSTAPRPRVAVVGGGLGGLAAAVELARRGLAPCVFDMGMRGPGGRMSTRRDHEGGRQYDHGCQFFRALGPEFRAMVDEWVAAGAAAPWQGRFGILQVSGPQGMPHFEQVHPGSRVLNGSSNRRSAGEAAPPSNSASPGFCELLDAVAAGEPVYVGVPGMDSLCVHLANASGIEHAWGTKVKRLERLPAGGWQLWGTMPEGRAATSIATNTSTAAAAAAGSAEGTAGAGPAAAPQGQQDLARPLGCFDAVVLSDAMFANPPSPGFIALPEGHAGLAELADAARSVRPQGVFCAMFTLPLDLQDVPFAAACVQGGGGELQWLACDSSKPGRPVRKGETDWVAIASEAYSDQLLQEHPLYLPGGGRHNPQTADYQAGVLPKLLGPALAALGSLVQPGVDLGPPLAARAHRWGRGFQSNPLALGTCTTNPVGQGAKRGDAASTALRLEEGGNLSAGVVGQDRYMQDGVALCGDYVGGGSRLECVVESGRAAAQDVAMHLRSRMPAANL